MAEPEIRYLGDLARLKIEPGDKFVLNVDEILSDEARSRIRDCWRQFAGDAPILILDRGFRLGLINTGED